MNVCVPLTVKVPELPDTVPIEVVPSDQLMVADRSELVSSIRALVTMASGRVKDTPGMYLKICFDGAIERCAMQRPTEQTFPPSHGVPSSKTLPLASAQPSAQDCPAAVQFFTTHSPPLQTLAKPGPQAVPSPAKPRM